MGSPSGERHHGRVPRVLRLAGVRYWTASVLPALVGTTLPFWLRPPGFSFRWAGAVEFIVAAVLVHSGFSFLRARFEPEASEEWPGSRLLVAGLTCIGVACVLGLHLSRLMTGSIFIVYGLATIFAGALYVVPPFRLCRTAAGEIVASQSLGFLPVLGAYLVQTGDLTRTVYMAALPIVAATGLWIWTGELASHAGDGGARSETLVGQFGVRFSGRVVVPAISGAIFAAIAVAALSSSVMPFALAAGLLLGVVWRVVAVSRNGYSDVVLMLEARAGAFRVHTGVCAVIIASSLATLIL